MIQPVIRFRLPVLFFFLLTLPALADERPTHIVQPGETLFSISRQYDVTLEELRAWNGLSDNVLRIGQELIVGSGRQPEPVEPEPEILEEPRTVTHIVEPGQTLYRISVMYDVSVEEIREWNNLTDNILSVGQRLLIRLPAEAGPQRPVIPRDEPPAIADQADDPPVPDHTEDPDPPVISDDNHFGDADAPAYYEVRPGDTLYRIASRFNMTLQELMTYNELKNSQIEVGQQLRIRSRSIAPPSVTSEWDVESTPQGRFVTYTFSEGDSLRQLLQHHQMELPEFRALNPGINPGDLRPGDDITLLIAATTVQRNPYLTRTADRGGSRMQVARYPTDRYRKTTTSGDLYNPKALTAAHPALSLGTVVYVENPENGHGIFVQVNDRTPENRLVLSDAAFQALGYHNGSQLIVEIHELANN